MLRDDTAATTAHMHPIGFQKLVLREKISTDLRTNKEYVIRVRKWTIYISLTKREIKHDLCAFVATMFT